MCRSGTRWSRSARLQSNGRSWKRMWLHLTRSSTAQRNDCRRRRDALRCRLVRTASLQTSRRHQRSRAAGSLVCSSTGCFSSALSAPPCCTRSTLTAQGKLGHLHGMQAHASILRLTGGALLACRHLVLAPVLANMAAQAVQTLVRRLLRRRRPLKDAIK